jgi:prepilin-type N-terminal cleavage/methylation domain-containing protein
MPLRFRYSQAGDTIVEVIIVLAILGLAISISYATASRSLLNTRQAQETAEASEYVQSQIEGIHALAADTNADTNSSGQIITPGGIVKQANAFCIINPNPQDPAVQIDSDPLPTDATPTCYPNSTIYHVVIYSCDRITTANNAICQTQSGNTVTGSDTYIVRANWPDVLGQGDDYVTQVYRIHTP